MSLTNDAADQGVLQGRAHASALALLDANIAAVVCASAAELPVQLQGISDSQLL
jgi:ABC-type cobalamin transport system permease subunit